MKYLERKRKRSKEGEGKESEEEKEHYLHPPPTTTTTTHTHYVPCQYFDVPAQKRGKLVPKARAALLIGDALPTVLPVIQWQQRFAVRVRALGRKLPSVH